MTFKVKSYNQNL